MKKLLLWLLMALWFSVQAQTPQLVSVSVINEEGHVELRWQQPDGIVADNYIIDRWDEIAGFVSLATLTNDQSFVWIDETAPSNTERCMYQVKSISNGIVSPGSNRLQSILIKELTYGGCALQNTLQWTEYAIEDIETVAQYRVWYTTDGTNWQLAAEVNGNESISGSIPNLWYIERLSNVYQYVHNLPATEFIYTYKIEPILTHNGQFSNFSSTPTPAYTQPEAPVLQNVTVANDQTIEATISIATPLLATEVSLLRTGSQAPAETNTLVFPVQTSSLFRDETAKTDEQSYIYTAGLKDTCGYLVEGVETHRTIHLKADRLNNTSIQLTWNSYEGWTVTEQEVWRYQGGDSTSLANILPGSEYLTDDLSLSTSQEAVIQYRVKAIGSTPVQVSFSNKVEVVLDFTPVLPNAFNPYSSIAENSTFKPVQEVYNSDGYSFQVFNRWGELIWESSSPSEGWDGRVGGQLMPKGTYVYLLKYLDVNSHLQHLRGSFVLIY